MVSRSNGFTVCDKLARIREPNDKASVVELALAGDIGDEKFRKVVVKSVVVGTTRNRDRCTVHVHLAISDLVEPSPGKSCIAVLHAFRNLKLKVFEAFAFIATSALSSRWSSISIGSYFRKVALSGDWAATNVTVDDLPLGFVGRRRVIVGYAELTRAATVNSTTSEFEIVVFPNLHGVGDASAVESIGTASTLAGEVVSFTVERRGLKSAEAIGYRCVHDDMSIGLCNEGKDRAQNNS